MNTFSDHRLLNFLFCVLKRKITTTDGHVNTLNITNAPV